jgi:hypothetical protein
MRIHSKKLGQNFFDITSVVSDKCPSQVLEKHPLKSLFASLRERERERERERDLFKFANLHQELAKCNHCVF